LQGDGRATTTRSTGVSLQSVHGARESTISTPEQAVRKTAGIKKANRNILIIGQLIPRDAPYRKKRKARY
jgi:hypothetical protein